MDKYLIINDPIYGFTKIKSELISQIIQHPYFQRLRRIKQLGLSELVYPSAQHTRFQHSIGAMHLMAKALDTLRAKDIEISDYEYEQAQIAILLHDIGHGPFSHALEFQLIKGINHESMSFLLIKELNRQLNNELELAIKIFQNTYSRPFFNQLVSSQLDLDRLDYLKRDRFFSGISEGSIDEERIISMLNVRKNKIVLEEKGIYSIENFLNVRRLMYWQVYLHKSCIGAERLLLKILLRAKQLIKYQQRLNTSPLLLCFLEKDYNIEDFNDKSLVDDFGRLDDFDVIGSIKLWQKSEDKILSTLCDMLLNRNLFHIQFVKKPIHKKILDKIRVSLSKTYNIQLSQTNFFYDIGFVSNKGYIVGNRGIDILTIDEKVINIIDKTDLPNIKAISNIVKKDYVCFPKHVYLPNS